jgi:hypothetical protein
MQSTARHLLLLLGALFLQLTVTVILAGLLLRPKLSVTVSLKARAVDTVGAINVGVAVVAPVKLTKVPDV